MCSCALLLISILLSSCVSLKSSNRLAYALSGGVTDISAYCGIESWEVVKDEVLELQGEDGSISYFAPFRVMIKSEAEPLMVITNDPIHGWRKEIGKAEERIIGPREYFIPLGTSMSSAKGAAEQRVLLEKLGIKQAKHVFSKSPRGFEADDIDDYNIVRRIPVPQLQEKLKAAHFSPAFDVMDFPSPSVFAWPFIAVTFIAIDLPVTVTASTVFATGYGVYVLCAPQ